MKRFYRDLRLSLIVATLAFGACWMVGNSFMGHRETTHDPHQWLHEQLNLTAEQDTKLEPIEAKFANHKKELEAEIHQANRELATAINEDGNYSPRVKQSVDKIHSAMGELQKVTLEHLFEMHSVLTPEQRKKLNSLTTDALTHNP
ncbi:MAG: Spy/CpxP family protein refolding chaperone [Rickettsiales bacterium]